jgi:hypothetical protein
MAPSSGGSHGRSRCRHARGRRQLPRLGRPRDGHHAHADGILHAHPRGDGLLDGALRPRRAAGGPGRPRAVAPGNAEPRRQDAAGCAGARARRRGDLQPSVPRRDPSPGHHDLQAGLPRRPAGRARRLPRPPPRRGRARGRQHLDRRSRRVRRRADDPAAQALPAGRPRRGDLRDHRQQHPRAPQDPRRPAGPGRGGHGRGATVPGVGRAARGRPARRDRGGVSRQLRALDARGPASLSERPLHGRGVHGRRRDLRRAGPDRGDGHPRGRRRDRGLRRLEPPGPRAVQLRAVVRLRGPSGSCCPSGAS